MLRLATITALALLVAGSAFAQQRLRARDRSGPGPGIAAKAGRLTAEEGRARQAQILAKRDNRQEEVDDRIAAGEAEVKAIQDQAKAEMRELTPEEAQRVAAIEGRIEAARQQRAAIMAQVDEVRERTEDKLEDAQRRRETAIRDRARTAGAASRGIDGPAGRRR